MLEQQGFPQVCSAARRFRAKRVWTREGFAPSTTETSNSLARRSAMSPQPKPASNTTEERPILAAWATALPRFAHASA
jgi:hypothetical protein